MPKMNGEEAIQKIREQDKETPIMIWSGDSRLVEHINGKYLNVYVEEKNGGIKPIIRFLNMIERNY